MSIPALTSAQMMPRRKILMLLSKSPDHDPRVQHEKQALEKAGYKVGIKYLDRARIPENATKLRIALWWLSSFLLRSTPDFVHAHDFDTLPAGVIIKRLTHCNLVFDVHDIPDHGRSVMTLMAHQADRVIAATDGLGGWLREHGVPVHAVVRNFRDVTASDWGPPPPPFTVGYFGGLDDRYLIRDILKLAGRMPDVRFVFGGNGPLRSLIKGPNVTYCGLLTPQGAIKEAARCHVLLCLLDMTSENSQRSLQNKLFDAMVAGRAIIIHSSNEAESIVRKEGFGICIRTMDDAYLAIQQLKASEFTVRDMGLLAHRAASRYSWAVESKKLVKMYDQLAATLPSIGW